MIGYPSGMFQILLALFACNDPAPPPSTTASAACEPAPLAAWCHGPEGPADCEPAPYEDLLPCDDYEVNTDAPSTGTTTHYFLDGEHVATSWSSDENEYCDGQSYVQWFGEEVDCAIDWPDTGLR